MTDVNPVNVLDGEDASKVRVADNSGTNSNSVVSTFLMASPARQLITCLVLLASASFAQIPAAPSSVQGLKPIITTLCSIIDSPKKYDRRLVQFSAHYESDGIEHSNLVEEAKCKWGIAPQFPEHLAGEEALRRAIFVDHPGTSDKVISATWTGVFRYHPGQRPRWVLQLRRMDDFKFACESCSELHKDDPIQLPEPPLPTWPPTS